MGRAVANRPIKIFWEVAVEAHRFRRDFLTALSRGLDPLTRPEPSLPFQHPLRIGRDASQSAGMNYCIHLIRVWVNVLGWGKRRTEAVGGSISKSVVGQNGKESGGELPVAQATRPPRTTSRSEICVQWPNRPSSTNSSSTYRGVSPA